MLQHVCQCCIPFEGLKNGPWCAGPPCVSVCSLLVDTWVVSTLGLLWTVLLWTCVHEDLFESLLSILLGLHLGVASWLMWSFYGSLSEELQNCFPQWRRPCTFPPVMCEGSHFYASSPTLIFHFLKNSSQPCGCGVVSPCVFDLHFPDDDNSDRLSLQVFFGH